MREAFAEFVNKVPFYGAAVLCLDDENVQRILPQVNRRVVTYGTSAQADLQVAECNCGHFASDFRLRFRGEDLGAFRLNVPGPHNVLNATAAIGIALELDVKPGLAREGLARYAGVDRRFQVRGTERGVTVVDDYGHHPTEIRATLAAARQRFTGRRIWAVWQPHTYSRTRLLQDDFIAAFDDADCVLITEIYAAREPQPSDGFSSVRLVEQLR